MASALRTRFINYMKLERLSPKTVQAYVGAVAGIAKYHSRSPDSLTNDQIQSYLLYLIEERNLAWSSCNVAFSGLRYFYLNILKWEETDFHIPARPRCRRLPLLMSRKEIRRLFAAVNNPKHRALLKTVYGAGLRVSEVVKLQPEHIESSRGLIRVEQGKGRKDRYTLLSDTLLAELRSYWRYCRPRKWLFFGRRKTDHIAIDSAQRIFYNAKKAAGITSGRGIHTLRHCFATHMLESGTDLYTLKQLLGHTALSTTIGYIHLTPKRTGSLQGPLDTLNE